MTTLFLTGILATVVAGGTEPRAASHAAEAPAAAALASFPFSIEDEVWGVLSGERFPDAAQWVLLEQRLACNEIPARGDNEPLAA